MAKESKIEWTDATLNPLMGCTPCSPGCEHCYALSQIRQRKGLKGWPKDEHTIAFFPERLEKLKSWSPRRVFMVSMGDLFHENVPFEFIDQVYGAMAVECQHKYMILTKRPERAAAFYEWLNQGVIEDDGIGLDHEDVFDHVWLGVTVCNQQEANEKIRTLLSIPAAHHWVSTEPCLDYINYELAVLRPGYRWADCLCEEIDPSDKPCIVCETPRLSGIELMVIGAESKGRYPGRPCDEAWLRPMVEQCKTNKVPVFVKQIHRDGKLVKSPEDYPQELPKGLVIS